MRKIIVATAFAAVLASIGAGTASAGQPVGPPACPRGFSYTMTLDQALVRYAGYYSEEEVRDGFALHDKNGNGYWCYRIMAGDRYFPLVNFFGGDDLENVGPA